MLRANTTTDDQRATTYANAAAVASAKAVAGAGVASQTLHHNPHANAAN